MNWGTSRISRAVVALPAVAPALAGSQFHRFRRCPGPLTVAAGNRRSLMGRVDTGKGLLRQDPATVDTGTSMPSVGSSLRMRGAPQVTFDLDILRIRLDKLALQRRPTAGSTPAGPEPLEPLAMPSHDRGRLDDGQGVLTYSTDGTGPPTERGPEPNPKPGRPPRARVRTPTWCRSARFSNAMASRARTCNS